MKPQKILLAFFLIASLTLPAWAQKKQPKPKVQRYDTLVTVSTQFGDIKLLLYQDTPLHRSNFLKLVKQKFYNDLLFHRVIKDFMVQGGDPDSKNAKADQMLGGGGPTYRVPAEFRANHFHKKGAIAAARDNNPEKASNGCQFYLVQGKKYNDEELKSLSRNGMVKYTPEQIEAYKKIGGTPFLDQNYTVFGEIIAGIEVIDTIANQPTGAANRPQKDIQMTISFKKMKKTEITKKYGYTYPELK